MNHEVTIQSLGDGVEEATFAEWLKEIGDEVSEGEAIAEVMTDKVNVEIEAPASGILLSQRCEGEDTVKVGQTIAEIGVAQ